MPQSKSYRPRTLSVVFGVFFLLLAIVAWYFGNSLGYHYAPDLTRWTYTVYMVTAAILLVGIGVAAVLSMRYLDYRIEKLEAASGAESEVVEEMVVEETVTEEVPPPLPETPAKGDHVDRDIDELLVSLQQMEAEAETADVEEPPVPEPVARTKRRVEVPVVSREQSRRLETLRRKRDGIHHFFAGPALAAVSIIGISAAMLPGSDAFLQSNASLNTTLLLGIGYAYAAVACYLAASILLLVRNR